jgi:hypothetical protein
MEAHDEALPCLALTDTVRSPAAYLRLTEVWSHRAEMPLWTMPASEMRSIRLFQSTLFWLVCGFDNGAKHKVSEYTSAAHNAMGPATFSQLTYERNFNGVFQAWSGWDFKVQEFNYVLTGVSGNSFQVSGYP